MVNGDNTIAEEVLPLDARWYAKPELIIDSYNNLLQCICRCTGIEVSIYDMMKKFNGILKQTFG